MKKFKILFVSILLSSLVLGGFGGIDFSLAAPPLAASFSPADGVSFVATSTSLVISFNQSVLAGSGSVHVKRLADDSIFVSVPASEALIVGSSVTINPAADLENDTGYYVTIDSNAFSNIDVENYVGIANRTTWNFHTKDELFKIEMVKNINNSNVDSYPEGFVATSGKVFFVAKEKEGSEKAIWVSDGTSEGTIKLKDSVNYTFDRNYWGGDNVNELQGYRVIEAFNSEVYFSVASSTGNYELWKTNGTLAGTTRVKVVGNNQAPVKFTVAGNTLFFVAGDSYSGEIWKTDGTEAGTFMLKDICSSYAECSSIPEYFTVMNGILYFTANDSVNGRELWRSDGTIVGTTLVKDIRAGSADASPAWLRVVDNTLYFSANDGTSGRELWKSDGSSAGTMRVRDIRSGASNSWPEFLTKVDNLLVFSANDGTNGYELWASNGTTSGTTMIKNITSGANSSEPEHFYNIGSTTYFFADDMVNGRELWKTDGTTIGTVMVKDIAAGTYGSASTTYEIILGLWPVIDPGFASIGDILYFYATDAINGVELWKSDGTAIGTVMVKDINPSGSSNPNKMRAIGNEVYFQANDGINGVELWKTDGSEAGTVMVKNLASGTYGSAASNFTVLNDELYFMANDGLTGRELWKSDGTSGGTSLVKDITSGGDSVLSYFSTTTNELFFQRTAGSAVQLWRSDGTTNGTALMRNIALGSAFGQYDVKTIGDRVYFPMTDGSGIEPWFYDTVASTVSRLKDVELGVGSSKPYDGYGFKSIGSEMYFSVYDGVDATELWKTDGTDAGTVLFKDFSPEFLDLLETTVVGDNLMFSVENDNWHNDLWFSDGTTLGTTLIKDNIGVSSMLPPAGFMAMDANKLFFIASSTDGLGDALWSSDGTSSGTNRYADLFDGGDSKQNFLKVIDGKVYFSASTDVSGTDGYDTTWVSNGTATGTVMLTTSNRGVGSDYVTKTPNEFWKFGSSVYFTAQDPLLGREIFKTDGTATGTVIVSDIYTGGDSCGRDYVSIGDYLYFTASNGLDGNELWRAYLISLPLASTSAVVSSVSASGATIGGSLNSLGKADSVEQGLVYGTSINPTTNNTKALQEEVSSVGSFSTTVTGLTCGTEYHFRAYAKNKAGTAYGSDQTFTTSACSCPPVDRATAYNSYPTCGPSACSSGYHVSGGVCAADSSGGGSSGGSGGAVSVPVANSSLIVSPSQSGNITKVFTNNNSVQLIVPQNSVGSQTTFNLAESSLSSSNAPTNSSRAFLIGGQAFSISAVNSSGQAVSSFKQPLTITIKLANLPATTTDLGVYYFDEKTKDWVFVPGAIFNSSSKSVTFTSDHLTLFAIFKLIGIKPSLADTIKTDPVVLVAPVITEAENIVNRYYSLIDVKLESQFSAKTATLRNYNYLSDTEKEAIVKFVTYGTPSTKTLGAGERLGVINSYLSAFGRLPKTVTDFNDVIKISTGRWPGATSLEAIANAKLSFKRIYLREADMNKPHDNAAVTITAYGLRSAKRNLNSEKVAIKIYKGIFKKAPTTATDWDTVRTIAYSGAKR